MVFQKIPKSKVLETGDSRISLSYNHIISYQLCKYLRVKVDDARISRMMMMMMVPAEVPSQAEKNCKRPKVWTCTPTTTNMTGWEITIFIRRYIFIHGWFSSVMLIFRGVTVFLPVSVATDLCHKLQPTVQASQPLLQRRGFQGYSHQSDLESRC